MVVFPNCKINLGLRIVRKREDGFHDLETVFHPVPLYDVLELIREPGSGKMKPLNQISFTSSGFGVEAVNDNLCVRAYRLLKKDFPQLPAIQMHLHKAIPVGAGLGGGSADAAFTLKLLNEKFKLDLSSEHLAGYALQLGSDCPFFVVNQTCLATGRGEILEPLFIELSGYKFLIVNPGINISTTQAFANINPVMPAKSIKDIIQQPVHSWKNELVNDFEKPIFRQYPEIETIKRKFYDMGAVYASMSGSGSTVYGIFEKNRQVTLLFPSHYFYKELIG